MAKPLIPAQIEAAVEVSLFEKKLDEALTPSSALMEDQADELRKMAKMKDIFIKLKSEFVNEQETEFVNIRSSGRIIKATYRIDAGSVISAISRGDTVSIKLPWQPDTEINLKPKQYEIWNG